MDLLSDEPVRSGQHYPVTDIAGRPPRTLQNFTGEVCLTLIRDDSGLPLPLAKSTGTGTEAIVLLHGIRQLVIKIDDRLRANRMRYGFSIPGSRSLRPGNG